MTDQPANNDAMMTVKEVAKYLRLSEATIYKLAKSNKIPVVRIGHNWRFHRKAVDDWMKIETPAEHREE